MYNELNYCNKGGIVSGKCKVILKLQNSILQTQRTVATQSYTEVWFSPWIVPDLRVCSPQALRGGRTSGGGSYLCACGRGWGDIADSPCDL